MDKIKFLRSHFTRHMFSSKICEIFENTNNSVDYLRTGARAKCYL